MKIISKIFMDKKGNIVIYILLAAGIILLTAGSAGFGSKKETAPTQTEAVSESSENGTEKRLAEILSQIKGAGRVNVMAVWENSGEKTFGYDTEGKQKKTVILNRGTGEEALVSEETTPKIRGVIIVADGGGNGKVKEALTHAAQTVLGIAPHKIEVFERNDSQ